MESGSGATECRRAIATRDRLNQSMSQRIRLGISTCPNDTYTFHALMNRLVDWRGLDFEIELLDIQQLNDRLFAGGFDVAKISNLAAMGKKLLNARIMLPTLQHALGLPLTQLLRLADPNDY